MTVAKVVYAGYVTLVGTLAEVVGSLAADKIPKSKVTIFHDTTNVNAVYSL